MAAKVLGRPKLYEAEIKTKLTRHQIEALDAIAQQRGVTRSDVIRAAVDSQLFVMDLYDRK
jgi:chromosome segregation and condensation protein ScpB